MELDSYNSVGISRGYGPCLVGDISNCHFSKEELKRQKAWIELQREKEKGLREELRQEREKRSKLEEKVQEERYK
jgi:hypothetical protein